MMICHGLTTTRTSADKLRRNPTSHGPTSMQLYGQYTSRGQRQKTPMQKMTLAIKGQMLAGRVPGLRTSRGLTHTPPFQSAENRIR